MLTYLKLVNVGPAPEMEIDFAERANLITGDNGLGKSFLLDSAWWALTRRWPQEVNDRMTSGFPARPRDKKKKAAIHFKVKGKTKRITEYSSSYSVRDEAWIGKRGRPWIPGLVIYAHAGGSFSVWDPARNYWKTKGDIDIQERLPAFVFTESEVWSGLYPEMSGKTIHACNGLLRDWSGWVRAKDRNAEIMEESLQGLSAAQEPGGIIKPGGPMRLSVNDVRDIPSIETDYAGAVPILHASSGVRRITALAYMLTWSWSEHQKAALQLGEEPNRQIIMLFDEVESHLHPRWQRVIVKALLDLARNLYSEASIQLIIATHSPLILASAEPWFDPKKDAWFDLDLDSKCDPPRVELHKRRYTLHGTAGNWLTSEAFDLKTDRGSVEAEQAILAARALLRRPDVPLNAIMEAHEKLRKVLPDLDPFWVRWRAFVEKRGGKP